MVLSTHGQPQRSGKPVWMLGIILIIVSLECILLNLELFRVVAAEASVYYLSCVPV